MSGGLRFVGRGVDILIEDIYSMSGGLQVCRAWCRYLTIEDIYSMSGGLRFVGRGVDI
jgi:hypothetical protein